MYEGWAIGFSEEHGGMEAYSEVQAPLLVYTDASSLSTLSI